MQIYFTVSQVPEMHGLSRAYRRTIWSGGFEMYCKEQPSRKARLRAINVCTVYCGLFIARELSRGTNHSWWSAPLIAGAAALAIGLVFQSLLTERLRPYFRRFLEEHRHDSERVA